MRPETWDHLRRQIQKAVEEHVNLDRDRIVEVIDRVIDKENEQAEKVDQSGGDSGIHRHAVEVLNDVRVRVIEGLSAGQTKKFV